MFHPGWQVRDLSSVWIDFFRCFHLLHILHDSTLEAGNKIHSIHPHIFPNGHLGLSYPCSIVFP